MNMRPSPVTPAEVNKQWVLKKCDYLMEVQLWPFRYVLNPERWLANFTESEMNHAVHLLNSFLYFSERFVDQMFIATFQSLSSLIIEKGEPLLSLQTAWRAFMDSVLITHVVGENPSVTDSGLLFARKSRQLLEVGESRILSPKEVLTELYFKGGSRPVVFVDDFVGSGEQFVKTWRREESLAGGVTVSFERIASVRRNDFFYCTLLSTQGGHDRLLRQVPRVKICAAHVLSSKYSALSADSLIWPEPLKPTAVQFIYEASMRAGIPDTDGADVNDWQGFNKQGLGLAFAHSVPDATLPIFYWEQNDWNPLARRS